MGPSRPSCSRSRARGWRRPSCLLARLFSREKETGRPGERLARALIDLGPVFIKLGQLLATRSDILGEEVAQDLARLQDRLPPFPGEEAVAILEAELGQPLEALFLSFDETPVSAASIAQVHYAVTTEGEPVAVKILRPGIEEAFARDVDLMSWIAEWIERSQPRLRRFKPLAVVKTFRAMVRVEIDLRLEAAAAAELAENFAGRYHLSRAPGGLAANDATGADPGAADRHPHGRPRGHAGRRASTSIWCSPAPRRSSSSRPSATASSTATSIPGTCSSISRAISAPSISASWAGSTARRATTSPTCCWASWSATIAGSPRCISPPASCRPTSRWTNSPRPAAPSASRSSAAPLDEISFAQVLGQLLRLSESFEMEAQPQLLLLQKNMLMAEGVSRQLNPALNIWTLAQPLVEQWMRENRGPEARIAEGTRELVRHRRPPARARRAMWKPPPRPPAAGSISRPRPWRRWRR